MITTENRQRIRRMHQEGSTITEISTALSVSRTTVYSYLRDQKRGLRVSRRGPVSKLAEANQDKLKEAIQALRGNASALGYLLRSEPQTHGDGDTLFCDFWRKLESLPVDMYAGSFRNHLHAMRDGHVRVRVSGIDQHCPFFFKQLCDRFAAINTSICDFGDPLIDCLL